MSKLGDKLKKAIGEVTVTNYVRVSHVDDGKGSFDQLVSVVRGYTKGRDTFLVLGWPTDGFGSGIREYLVKDVSKSDLDWFVSLHDTTDDKKALFLAQTLHPFDDEEIERFDAHTHEKMTQVQVDVAKLIAEKDGESL